MIRRRRGLSVLCLLMLITMLYLWGSPVSAEEKLFKASDGIFKDDEFNFEEDGANFGFFGKSISKTAYKYVTEYNGTYYYEVSDGSNFSTDDLTKALSEAVVIKEGDRIFIPTNLSGEETKTAYQSKASEYTTYVYTESDELKYTITHDKMSDFVSNTSISHEVSITRGSAVTDSSGNIIGYYYSVSNNKISYLNLSIGDLSYAVGISDGKFKFTGVNGTYDYEATLADGYIVTGKLEQTGVVPETQEYDFTPDTYTEVQNPKLSVSGIPKKKCESFELTITSDIDAQINFNGQGKEKYSKKATFTVDSNGTFYYTAVTKDGGYTQESITIDCIGRDEGTWEPEAWSGQI